MGRGSRKEPRSRAARLGMDSGDWLRFQETPGFQEAPFSGAPFSGNSVFRRPLFPGGSVSGNRLADFDVGFRGLAGLGSEGGQRDKSVFGLYRFFFQNNLAIEGGHARVIRRVVFLFCVAGTDLLFARVLGDAELVEIVLLFGSD